MAYVSAEELDRGSRRYISTTMEAPLLERETEYELARRWREEQDEAALHELVNAYGRFVVRIAAGFKGYGLPLSDLIQEGNVGLMEAAARFDPGREVRFSTYASWWVCAAIQDYILRNSSIVRLATTATQKSLFFNLRRLRARLAESPEGAMTDADRQRIATELGVPVAAVERMESHLSAPDQSLNAPMGLEDGEEMQSFLSDDGPNPEEIVGHLHDSRTRTAWIGQALDQLTPREREIITSRFLSGQRSTLAEIGDSFGLTKERIRQIERKALDKMRVALSGMAQDPSEVMV